MSRRHWLAVIALGLALGSVQAQPLPEADTGRHDAAEPQTKPKPGAIERLLPALHGDLQRLSRAVEGQRADANSPEEKERAQRDLESQERMAFWAMWAFIIASAEVALTGVGVWLVYLTWRATLANNREMIRLERPYLIAQSFSHKGLPTAAKLNGGDCLATISGAVINHGDRMAILHSVHANFDWRKEEELPLPLLPSTSSAFFMHQAIRPPDPYIQNPWFGKVLPAQAVNDIVADGQYWFLYGYLRYSDPHGIIRRSGFAFRYKRGTAPVELPPVQFSVCGPGEYWYDVEEKSGNDRTT